MNHIDQSLNLLKDLEVRLKYRKQQPQQSPSLRIRTEHQESSMKNSMPWAQKLQAANENAEDQLKYENRQLKRQVNKLLKMNDYLKNQLVQGQHYSSKNKKSQGVKGTQIEMLKIEIQYLKQLNRQKQLKIELMHRDKRQASKKKSTASCYSSNKSGHTRQLSQPVSNMPQKHDTMRTYASFKKKDDNTMRKSVRTNKKKCPLCYS